MIACDLAKDEAELLVVTDNGFGKRTRISEYRRTKRGAYGVRTIKLLESRGKLAGAMVVRPEYQVMLISTGGTVIRMPVEQIRRTGRLTQGVNVMTLREDERVSALAPVVEPDDAVNGDAAAPEAAASPNGFGPEEPDEDES